MRALAAGLVALACGAPPAIAQQWRTVEVSRQLHDSAQHRVRVDYGGGRLELHATPPGSRMLYELELRYDQQRVQPVHRWSPEERTIALGVERSGVPMGRSLDGEMRLALSGAARLDLSLDLAAVNAQLALGGLALEELRLDVAASEATIEFGAPNRVPMRQMDVQVAAASLDATGLANGNVARMRVRATAGNIDLAFDGAWESDIELDARVTFAALTVRVPPDVGIRADLRRVLGSLAHDGRLVQRDDALYSRNWDSATRRITIRGSATLGGITIEPITN